MIPVHASPWAGPALAASNPLAAVGLALLSLGLPIGLAAWFRRGALAAPATNVAAAWFGYARRAQWLVIGAWLSWVAALSLCGLDRVVAVVMRPAGALPSSLTLWTFTILPPSLAGLAIQALTHDVQRRLRGSEWTMSEHLRCSVWQLAALLVPLSLVMLAVLACLTGHGTMGALSAIGVVFTRMWFLRLYTEALGLAPHAVTTGPLRDRLFELANRAAVPLRQLYVIPTTRGRLANAFAMNGGTVILTDYLLEHLSEREVVATMAHEIGHLKYDHPRRLLLTLMLSMAGTFTVMSVLQMMYRYPFMLLTTVSIAVASFITMLFARGFERVADRAAVDLTGDPEALITALARLSRLNHVPLEWGVWAEKSLTHPSTLRRARAIADHGKLPEGRVNELLAALPPASPRFAIEIPKQDERLFTTLWKARVAANTGLTLLALYAVVPAVVIAMLRSDHPSMLVRLGTLAIAILAGAAVTLGAMDALTVRPYLKLRRKTMERWATRGIDPERCGGRFVGMSPGREPRIYESSGDWDVGEMFVMRQRLCYVGEEAKFELTRAQVVSVELGPGLPGWISAPRVVVSWRDESRGTEGALAFRPAEVRTLAAVAAESQGLLERLRGWQRGVVTPNPDPAIETLGPPPTGAVTSVEPSSIVAPRAIASALIISAFAAATASGILGLRFSGGPGFFDVLTATWAVALFHRAPYWMRARAKVARAAEAATERVTRDADRAA